MGKFTLIPEVSPEGFVSLGLFTFNTAAKFLFLLVGYTYSSKVTWKNCFATVSKPTKRNKTHKKSLRPGVG